MTEQNLEFEALANQFLEDYWQLNPVDATDSGVHRYDHLVPDWSQAGQAARQSWLAKYQAAFKSFADKDLSVSQQLDKKVALGELAAQEVYADWQWQNRYPAFYVELAMNGLNFLLARPDETIPLAERERKLLSRLRAIPALLAQGRETLKAELIPPEFVEIGLVAVRGATSFVRGLKLPDQSESTELQVKVLTALTEYEAFISQLQPTGKFELGAQRFERLLREQHGLDLTPDQLYEVGEKTAARLQIRLDELAQQIDPARSWSEIVEGLKSDHPTRETLLQTYADEAARARAFVKEKALVTIPPGEEFEVRATAPFLRATMPLGHFEKTPPFAPEDNLGVLYITPIDPTLPEKRQDELLSAHCYTAVRAICLHETFPGHHLQLWWAKKVGSPICRQFSSTLYAEGWALYCEELMEETGFFDTPALSLWQIKNSMWRAVRIMIDVGLHCGKLDLAAAAHLLVEKAGLEPNTALGEARRYTTSPTQPSSYMLGRNRIVELRHQYEQVKGGDFDLREFHDNLLAYSSISPAFIPDRLGI